MVAIYNNNGIIVIMYQCYITCICKYIEIQIYGIADSYQCDITYMAYMHI